MLKGFHCPLTPTGKASLNPSPPWHYSSDFLAIEFWAEPARVAELLPEDLIPDTAANGRAIAYFYDWQFSGDNEEFLDPARYQYREFFILVDAVLDGHPVSYCPYIFVDNDAAMARGWSQGYPKRLAQVFQTRLHAAPSKAAPRLAPGGRFAGSMTSSGQRLAEGVVTLERPLTDAGAFGQRPVVNLLHTPRLAAGMHDQPAVHELVMNVPRDVRVVEAWIGQGQLRLPEARGEEMSALAPLRCGAGIRASMSYIVDDLRTVKQLKQAAK
jgi:acetoacetate decarboxylase